MDEQIIELKKKTFHNIKDNIKLYLWNVNTPKNIG